MKLYSYFKCFIVAFTNHQKIRKSLVCPHYPHILQHVAKSNITTPYCNSLISPQLHPHHPLNDNSSVDKEFVNVKINLELPLMFYVAHPKVLYGGFRPVFIGVFRTLTNI